MLACSIYISLRNVRSYNTNNNSLKLCKAAKFQISVLRITIGVLRNILTNSMYTCLHLYSEKVMITFLTFTDFCTFLIFAYRSIVKK